MEADVSNDETDGKQKYFFMIGLMILIGWMLVILICAYPQLFRNIIKRYAFCWKRKKNENDQKMRLARENMRSARRSFIGATIAQSDYRGSSIHIDEQMLGPSAMERDGASMSEESICLVALKC